MEVEQKLASESTTDVESKPEAMDVDVHQQSSKSASQTNVAVAQSEGNEQTPISEQCAVSHKADLKEYEVEYFGFTPQSFANGVYNAMVDYLQDAVEVTQDYIMKEFATKDDVSEEVVKQGSDRLFAVFIDTFNNTFDRLESYLLKNIFHIPSHVVLPEDKVNQEHQYSEAEESQLDTELEELRQKVKDAKYVNARLRQWMQEVEAVQAQLDTFLAQLNAWHSICKQNNVTNLAESITFVGGKMQRLQGELTKVLQQKKTWIQRSQAETQIQVDSSKF